MATKYHFVGNMDDIFGDLFAIKAVQAYLVSHRECSAIAAEEMRSDARPELSTHVENMDEYDTIYIGYPICWYQEPMAIRTFLEEYDFSGKTIIPSFICGTFRYWRSARNLTGYSDCRDLID